MFWAVIAVTALVPYTPWAANVLRSAWMPAPPPESLPAIVSAVCIRKIRSQCLFAPPASTPRNAAHHRRRPATLDRGSLVAALLVTALTAVAAQISVPLPFTPVPFTLQPMVVLLGGAALGARLGMASQVLYLALGIAGFPVFAASAACRRASCACSDPPADTS